jgi:DNA adenine methylase Dam
VSIFPITRYPEHGRTPNEQNTLLRIKELMEYINTPFNYTGSKFKLLPQILPHFDFTKKYFVDLFTGGGSVYANVVDRYEKVLINDIIEELIGIHNNLINNPTDFIESTKQWVLKDKEDHIGYSELRKSFNEDKTPEKLFALMLSCTNNMMRFNKKFEFNQTFGKRTWNDSTEKKVNTFVEHISGYRDRIIPVSRSFRDIVTNRPAMYYIDPPYTNTEAGYNSYWSQESENALYDYIQGLNDKGDSFILSGVRGPHKNGKESELINRLLSDGFNYKYIDHDYKKVSRSKEERTSREIIILNY